jgi:hypothetical protein
MVHPRLQLEVGQILKNGWRVTSTERPRIPSNGRYAFHLGIHVACPRCQGHTIVGQQNIGATRSCGCQSPNKGSRETSANRARRRQPIQAKWFQESFGYSVQQGVQWLGNIDYLEEIIWARHQRVEQLAAIDHMNHARSVPKSLDPARLIPSPQFAQLRSHDLPVGGYFFARARLQLSTKLLVSASI